MSFNLGEEILIINGVQQNGFDSYFVWVQAFGFL